MPGDTADYQSIGNDVGFERVGRRGYTPITDRQVRLFKLFPFSSTSGQHCRVRGELEVVDLDDNPDYLALSYTWGTKSDCKLIMINRKRFRVRRNLYDFLKVRSKWGLDTKLWIDQICIDQKAVNERNHQVQLMSLIYSRARLVLVWLGKDKSMKPRVSDVAATLVSRCGRRERNNHDRREGRDWLRRKLDNEISQSDRAALRILFHHEYWSRAWIMQELLLARSISILWGKEMISWDHFSAIARHDIFENAKTGFFSRWATTGQTFHPAVLFLYCDKTLCEDPRDLCYAIQGLLKPKNRIQIDYGRSTARVFFDMAVVMLRCSDLIMVWFDLRRLAAAMAQISLNRDKSHLAVPDADARGNVNGTASELYF